MTRLLQIISLLAVLIATIYFAIVYFLPEIVNVAGTLAIVLLPFIAALLIAMLMEPLIRLLMVKLKMKRGLAVFFSMLSVFSLLGIIIFIAVFRLAAELMDLSISLPHYINLATSFIESTFQKGKILFFSLPQGVINQVNDNLNTVTDYLTVLASSFAGSLISFAVSLPSAVLAILVTILATFFFSKDREVVVKFIYDIIPHPWGDRFLEVSREITKAFINYIRAQSLLITITTIQAIVGLYIIGSQYALTIGFLVGFLDVIPVLGPAGVFVPWIIWSFVMGNTSFGIKLTILYAFIWIVRQLLEPRVVAANLGLHPLAVLIVMYVGLKLMGVLGLILGPVFLIAGEATYKVIRQMK